MHRNAPLTPQGRLRLCQMIEEGWTIASSAESMRISRQTAHKWWRRYLDAGVAGLEDRSSRPRRCPTKTPARRRCGSSPVRGGGSVVGISPHCGGARRCLAGDTPARRPRPSRSRWRPVRTATARVWPTRLPTPARPACIRLPDICASAKWPQN
jgi:hypothetical protein